VQLQHGDPKKLRPSRSSQCANLYRPDATQHDAYLQLARVIETKHHRDGENIPPRIVHAVRNTNFVREHQYGFEPTRSSRSMPRFKGNARTRGVYLATASFGFFLRCVSLAPRRSLKRIDDHLLFRPRKSAGFTVGGCRTTKHREGRNDADFVPRLVGPAVVAEKPRFGFRRAARRQAAAPAFAQPPLFLLAAEVIGVGVASAPTRASPISTLALSHMRFLRRRWCRGPEEKMGRERSESSAPIAIGERRARHARAHAREPGPGRACFLFGRSVVEGRNRDSKSGARPAFERRFVGVGWCRSSCVPRRPPTRRHGGLTLIFVVFGFEVVARVTRRIPRSGQRAPLNTMRRSARALPSADNSKKPARQRAASRTARYLRDTWPDGCRFSAAGRATKNHPAIGGIIQGFVGRGRTRRFRHALHMAVRPSIENQPAHCEDLRFPLLPEPAPRGARGIQHAPAEEGKTGHVVFAPWIDERIVVGV